MDAAIAAEASIRSSVVKTKDSGDTKKADTGKSTSSDTSKDGDKDTKKADTSKDSGKDAKKDTRKKLSPKLQAFKTLLQSDEVSQDVKDAIKKYHRIGVTKEGKLYKVKDRAQEMADARSGNSKKTNYLE
jgi:negative regulator of replication initiation